MSNTCESDGSRLPSLTVAAESEWCGLPQAVLGTVNANGAEIMRIELEFARTHWPSEQVDIHHLEAENRNANAHSFVIPESLRIGNGGRMLFRLKATYKRMFGEEEELRFAYSEIDTASLCCASQSFEDFLVADQELVVERFGDFSSDWPSAISADGGFSLGENFGDDEYRYVASHGKCCYARMGVAVARTDQMSDLIPGYPNVLFYAPPEDLPTEDACDLGKDFPYELIGWAYAIPYNPFQSPGENQCFPVHEWMIHEAGFHYLNSGDFCLTAPTEAYPGEMMASQSSGNPCLGTCNLCPRKWHGRMWDMHIWRNDSGVPEIAVEHPASIPLNCEATLPPGSFFYPKPRY